MCVFCHQMSIYMYRAHAFHMKTSFVCESNSLCIRNVYVLMSTKTCMNEDMHCTAKVSAHQSGSYGSTVLRIL
jgi:3-methyladenine DNA glycosylase Mpg